MHNVRLPFAPGREFLTPEWQDPQAAAMRVKMRASQPPKDLASKTMRLALHLSDREHMLLTMLNPETLGAPDGRVRSASWAKFIRSPQSLKYRVNKV